MLLYRLALALLLPALIARLCWRVLRGTEPRAAFCERLGGGAAAAPGALWLHAASNGELASARPLIEAMLNARPDLRMLITTNTVTARALAQDWAESWANGRIEARAAPLDARFLLARFLNRHRPAGLVVIENELWPNRLLALRARGLPAMVAGGRMSARSARRWRKSGLGRRLAPALTAVSAQDPASEAGFLALGLPRARLLPMLNLKTAVAAPAPDWSPGWDRDATVLAASTHEGEEEIVLDAFAAARSARPDLRLILAPRHPRRAPQIARLITARGLAHVSRSSGAAAEAPVLLADTMGEMANWYAAASLCFVGGSLTDKGGHTPYEPAAYDCAIAHGPHVDNHAAAFAALDAAGAAVRVDDSVALRDAYLLNATAKAALAAHAAKALAALSGKAAVAGLAQSILSHVPATNSDENRPF